MDDQFLSREEQTQIYIQNLKRQIDALLEINDRTSDKLAEQVEINERLRWNNDLGCYTRQGFEVSIWPDIAVKANWFIFYDIDDMKGLNEEHGWDGASAILKKVNSVGHRAGDYIIGQILSGDEFGAVIVERDDVLTDPVAFCQRIQLLLSLDGVSATFAFSVITSPNLDDNLLPLKAAVMKAKAEDRRGSINAV